MGYRYGSITNNGTEYWYKITQHFEDHLEGRFGKGKAHQLRDTLILLERQEFDFGADEEFVVRDFRNKTVVVYSESYQIIKGKNETVINLITDFVEDDARRNGAETFKQAPYSRVIVFDQNGILVDDVPMYYEEYLNWFQTTFKQSSQKSWKWPGAWNHRNNYKKKVNALKKNIEFCNNINTNLQKYPPAELAKNNILNSI